METKEPQYSEIFDYPDTKIGAMANQVWHDDPKRLVFVLSRYKFVAKMLAGRSSVLEVGCADGFGSRIVAKEVDRLQVTDFDPVFVEYVQTNAVEQWQKDAQVYDVTKGANAEQFDAVFCLDVFEHILPEFEALVLQNLKDSVTDKGAIIIGIPSLESQHYASPQSKEGHVNCKSGDDFKKFLEAHFANVFVFSMNDEVVHTGFYPMAHYLLAICLK